MADNRSTLNDQISGGDTYARESFTFRRMLPWQIWGLVGVLLLFVLLLLML
jgi:hypothetical protein